LALAAELNISKVVMVARLMTGFIADHYDSGGMLLR
jgi:hypothetical protein